MLIGVTRLWGATVFPPYKWFASIAYGLPAPSCFLLLVAVLPIRPTLFTSALSLPMMQYLGRLSYSLYLVHLYVLYSFLNLSVFLRNGAIVQYYVLFISACLVLAQISYYGIEQPFLKLKNENSWLRRTGFPFPTVLTWSLIIIGISRLVFTMR